ncbi:MAG: hypothetical protein Q9217_001182 [Psora testacea]
MGDLSISLQAPPTVDPEKHSLQYLIARINEQKGSFRNVTEVSLEEEIRNDADGEIAVGDEGSLVAVEEVEDIRSKKDEVYKARDEMLKQIGQAQQESAMALDFVSLLLSQGTPGPAGLTLSPFLRQNLPLGSLGVEIVQAPEESESERQLGEMVAMGWRMQALSDVADSLLNSASRLGGEVERETRYWDQVLAVKEKRWSLSRLPREKNTLGVRYGFAEAYSSFRDRGLAALRQDEEGNLSLDHGHRSSVNRRLRVRVLRKDVSISASSDPPEFGAQGEPLEHDILEARNSIFEEELDHELHREAQHLANQGVQCIDNIILLPYEEDKQIEIGLTPKDGIEDRESSKDDNISDIIALFLRILLSQAHQENLKHRSQPPAPIREGQYPRPVYAILKPVIELLQHRSRVASIYDLLEKYRRSFAKAGLLLSIQVDYPSLGPTEAFSQAAKSTSSRTQAFTDFVTALSSVKITMYVLDSDPSIVIDVNTRISSPTFGTTYRIQNTSANDSDIVYSYLPDLEREVSHILQEAIKNYIATTINGWHGAEVGVEMVSRFNSDLSRRESISVKLETRHLSLVLHASGSVEQQRAWQWHAEESGQGEKRSLQEVLGRIQRPRHKNITLCHFLQPSIHPSIHPPLPESIQRPINLGKIIQGDPQPAAEADMKGRGPSKPFLCSRGEAIVPCGEIYATVGKAGKPQDNANYWASHVTEDIILGPALDSLGQEFLCLGM